MVEQGSNHIVDFIGLGDGIEGVCGAESIPEGKNIIAFEWLVMVNFSIGSFIRSEGVRVLYRGERSAVKGGLREGFQSFV
jgi:hypothetical protein